MALHALPTLLKQKTFLQSLSPEERERLLGSTRGSVPDVLNVKEKAISEHATTILLPSMPRPEVYEQAAAPRAQCNLPMEQAGLLRGPLRLGNEAQPRKEVRQQGSEGAGGQKTPLLPLLSCHAYEMWRPRHVQATRPQRSAAPARG